MSGDATMQAVVLMLVLILPVSTLAARRLPLTTTAKYAGAWFALFLIGYLIIVSFT